MKKIITRIPLLFVLLISFLYICFYEISVASSEDDEIERKIASCMVWGIDGTGPEDLSEYTTPFLEKGGHLILYGRNIESPTQLQYLTDSLVSVSPSSLLWVDREGTTVDRLPESKGFKGLSVTAKEVVSLYPPSKINEVVDLYYQSGEEMSGYHLHNFAPVIDLDGGSPAISPKGRSYGTDPSLVTMYARACIEGYRKAKRITAIKHWPGHGFILDSHFDLPDSTIVAKTEELESYESLIKEGSAQAVMVGHIVNTDYDPTGTPATFSSVMVDQLLRRDLGFEGVVISDALGMGAVQKYIGSKMGISDPDAILREALIEALAVCDLIVYGSNDDIKFSPLMAIDVLKKGIEKGDITEKHINESVERIEILKRRVQ